MMTERKKIKNLALCGGGFYGYAELGALKELEKYKEYFDIQTIKGVSVGSIVAVLYAIGYTIDELIKILFETDFDNLIKDKYFPRIHLYSNYGMHDANELENEIERLISVKTNIRLCTFSQIRKDLTIIATNLNYQCPKFFNKENTPNVAISKAVRCSISFPFIMTPVLFEGDLYIDGGAYINYPITTFKDQELDETIGITFSTYNENLDRSLKEKYPINDVYDYFISLGQTMTRSAYLAQITDRHFQRSLVIKISENISSMQFRLTEEQKKYIYQCGIDAVKNQISKILDIEKLE